MVKSYIKFIKLLRRPKNLIINQDSEGNKKLFGRLDERFLKSINLYGYTVSNNPLIKLDSSLKGEMLELFVDREFCQKVHNSGRRFLMRF